jgi:UDP-glucose 4-epimerase
MSWKGKNVLVTGASGFIGNYLTDALIKSGALVTALSMTGGKEGKIRWLKGDITSPDSIKGVCDGIHTVYHLAAISNVDKSIKNPTLALGTNTVGTMNLLEEVRRANVKKFIYISSAHVYGAPQHVPVDEAHPVVPREPYAASKIASEMIVQAYGNAYGIGHAIIRPFNIFGAGQDESFLIPGVIAQALRNKQIKVGNMEPTRDFLYVKDCVSGFLAVGDRGSGVYNIGTGSEITIQKVVEKIRDLVDPKIPIVSDESRIRAGKVEIMRMYADTSKITGLGWKPKYSFDEGLAETIEREIALRK